MTKQLNLRKNLLTKPTTTQREASVEQLSQNLSEMVEGIKERRGTAPNTKREATPNIEMDSAQ